MLAKTSPRLLYSTDFHYSKGITHLWLQTADLDTLNSRRPSAYWLAWPMATRKISCALAKSTPISAAPFTSTRRSPSLIRPSAWTRASASIRCTSRPARSRRDAASYVGTTWMPSVCASSPLGRHSSSTTVNTWSGSSGLRGDECSLLGSLLLLVLLAGHSLLLE